MLRLCAAVAYRSVQWRAPVPVHLVRVGPGCQQRPDRGALSVRVPPRGAWPTVHRIVERLGAAAVASADIGAACKQVANGDRVVGRGRQVQRGVTGVELVMELDREVLLVWADR